MSLLESFLNKQLSDAEYIVSPLAGDASSRRYYRVMSGQKSWVLMEWEPFQEVADFPFLSVQQYFAKNGVRVPKIYDYDKDTGLFLLEDLGDLTLERRFWEFQNQEVVAPYYKKTLDQLIQIHSLSFNEPGPRECTAYGNEFSVEKLVWEMNYAKKYLIKELLQYPLSHSEESQLEHDFLTICTQLYQSPQVICHRDFHSRNVMLHFNDVVVIDFQDARLGPPVYDLVSLFCDSYVDLNPEVVAQLMDYYILNFTYFQELGLSREQFQSFYDLQTLQRCFKACGSFASFKVTRDDTRYLGYIAPTLTRVLNQLEQSQLSPTLQNILIQTQESWKAF